MPAVPGVLEREATLFRALGALARSWDAHRRIDVSTANCIASAAAQLLKLEAFQRMRNERVVDWVSFYIEERAEVFLAIAYDFGVPRGERAADQANPSATAQPHPAEPEIAF